MDALGRTVGVSLAIAAIFAGSACTGGRTSAEPRSAERPDVVVDRLVNDMVSAKDLPASNRQVRCYVKRAVDLVGEERLATAGSSGILGIAPMQVGEEKANDVYEAMVECGIDVRRVMLARMMGVTDLDHGSAACVDRAVSDDDLRRYIVDTLAGGEQGTSDSAKRLVNAMITCAPAAGPSTAGD